MPSCSPSRISSLQSWPALSFSPTWALYLTRLELQSTRSCKAVKASSTSCIRTQLPLSMVRPFSPSCSSWWCWRLAWAQSWRPCKHSSRHSRISFPFWRKPFGTRWSRWQSFAPSTFLLASCLRRELAPIGLRYSTATRPVGPYFSLPRFSACASLGSTVWRSLSMM